MHPNVLERRVAGHTPAVITETFYALAVAQSPAFVATEVVIVTTESGKKKCLELKLEDQLDSLCTQYQLPLIPSPVFQMLCDEHAVPLQDVRLQSEIRAAENFIYDVVRKLTSDAECALHASLAGGRKTMSSHLQAAMQLYARAQDRLSHVLVNPIFEGKVRDAFFPTRPATLFHYKEIVHTPSGEQIEKREISSDDMQIDLGYVDFIPLRDGLPKVLQDRKFSAQEATRIARAAYDEPDLHFDMNTRIASVAGLALKLEDKAFWGYAWLSWRRKQGLEPLNFKAIAADFELHAQMKPFWVGVRAPDRDGANRRLESWELAVKMTDEDWAKFFQSPISRSLNNALKAISPLFLARYQVQSNEEMAKGITRYFVDLPPSAIRFSGLEL